MGAPSFQLSSSFIWDLFKGFILSGECLFVFFKNLEKKIIDLFIFGRVGSSLLRVGGERGLLFAVVRGLLIAVASLVAEHGL